MNNARVFESNNSTIPIIRLMGNLKKFLFTERAARVLTEQPGIFIAKAEPAPHLIPTVDNKPVVEVLVDSRGVEILRHFILRTDAIGDFSVFFHGEDKLPVLFSDRFNQQTVSPYPHPLSFLHIFADKIQAENNFSGNKFQREILENTEKGIAVNNEVSKGLNIAFLAEGKLACYRCSDLLYIYKSLTKIKPWLEGKLLYNRAVDAGSGLGHLSFVFSLFFPEVVGIEQSRILYEESIKSRDQLQNSLQGQVSFEHGNFNDYDLTKFGFVYLWQNGYLHLFMPKLLTLTSGTWVYFFSIGRSEIQDIFLRNKAAFAGAEELGFRVNDIAPVSNSLTCAPNGLYNWLCHRI